MFIKTDGGVGISGDFRRWPRRLLLIDGESDVCGIVIVREGRNNDVGSFDVSVIKVSRDGEAVGLVDVADVQRTGDGVFDVLAAHGKFVDVDALRSDNRLLVEYGIAAHHGFVDVTFECLGSFKSRHFVFFRGHTFQCSMNRAI